jgi:hypothetical protein
VPAFPTQGFDDLQDFSAWPLLPTVNGELSAVKSLEASTLVWQPPDGDLDPTVASALARLGVRCVGTFSRVCKHGLLTSGFRFRKSGSKPSCDLKCIVP